MKTIQRLLAAAVGAVMLSTPAALAAGEQHHPEEHDWSWEGPFGTYDKGELQRGFLVYQQVCSACHSMNQLHIRNLGEEGGPFFSEEFPNPNDNPIVRAIAAEYIVEDGPDELGDMFERPGRPSDRFPNPFANPQQAAASNGGAIPPDFSVIIKARHSGPEYIRSLLLGYDHEAPHDVNVAPGQYYNPYFPGGLLAMPPQLQDGLVEYADGTEATTEQMAHDVVTFLTWASEPHMNVRKKMGLMVMIYLLVLAGLLYAAYRQVWSNVKH
ncbi:cytochrome c1 [Oceanicaulis sp. LC35]|uniref:cytochrome c1 n=1 Tax=Oceanicaulis sp. LC35 TaxID=3349635 RepID=UPI003F877801